MMRPKIQVALDLLELDRAVQIAKESVEGGADWIEAGTPLIKSEGMDAVRRLREKFPKQTILADMKTMDTGALEVEMAIKAGADVVSILAAADNSTVQDALRSAKEYGALLMVDIINVPDPVKKAKELEEIGVDYICVHVGIDQQMVGVDTIDLLERIVKEVNTPLAVGGGLDAQASTRAVVAGAEVVIVGGNIIRSADVTGSTKLIRDAIDNAEIRERKRETLEEETIRLFMEVSTPNISDAMHREPCMRGIRPIYEGIKVAGRAATVQTFGGDWAKTVEAIDVARAGEILVIFNGSDHITPWGELASHSAQNRGIKALVIDGPVRDIDDIRKMRFPIFSSGIVSNAGDPKGFGEINAEIICGGIRVGPGDYIVADDNGVMVIPKERGYEIARRAMEVKKNEDRVREEIRRGKTLSQVIELYKWEKKQK